jgi:hypothetical protein
VKLWKKIAIVSLFLALIATLCGVEIMRKAQPTLRENPAKPLYTIGERDTYSPALAEGKKVVKFGPMFFGLYPGGLAFAAPHEARAYLEDHNWDPQRWSVYRLSGDFERDSANGHVSRALLVLEEIN